MKSKEKNSKHHEKQTNAISAHENHMSMCDNIQSLKAKHIKCLLKLLFKQLKIPRFRGSVTPCSKKNIFLDGSKNLNLIEYLDLGCQYLHEFEKLDKTNNILRFQRDFLLTRKKREKKWKIKEKNCGNFSGKFFHPEKFPVEKFPLTTLYLYTCIAVASSPLAGVLQKPTFSFVQYEEESSAQAALKGENFQTLNGCKMSKFIVILCSLCSPGLGT